MTAPPFYLYAQTPAPDCFLLGDSFELLPQIAAGIAAEKNKAKP